MSSRYRTKLNASSIEPCIKTYNGNPFQSIDTQLLFDFEEMSDEVVAGYHKKIAQGGVVNNPCSYQHEVSHAGGGSYYAIHPTLGEYATSGGSISRYQYSFWNTATRDAINSQIELPDEVSNMIARAQAKAISNIDSSPHDILEDLLELRQTVKFLRDPVGRLQNLANSFGKESKKLLNNKGTTDKVRFSKRVIKSLADLWLEYRFAFRPLVNTAFTLVDSFVAPAVVPKRRTARGFDSSGKLHENGTSQTYYTPTVFDTVKYSKNRELVVRAQILYEIDSPRSDLAFKYGVKLSDLPQGLWNLFPYSFMIDRVTDISSFINGCVELTKPSLRILSGCTVVRDTEDYSFEFLNQVNPGWTVEVSGDQVNTIKFSYSRTTWTPTYHDTLPGFNLGGLTRDAKSIADGLALVSQLVKI